MSRFALKQNGFISDDFQSSDDHVQLSVGTILRNARELRGEPLSAVSLVLRISETYLSALEEDDGSKMPEMVYTLGFLKTYGQYLGLDAEDLVTKFKYQFIKSIKTEPLVFPAPAQERSIPTSSLVIIACGLSLLIVVSWLYLKPTSKVADEFQNLSPATVVEKTTEPASDEKEVDIEISPLAAVPETTTAQPTELSENKKFTQAYPIFPIQDNRPYDETRAAKIIIDDKGIHLGEGESFIILARDESWVEIKNNVGDVIFTKTLKAGESQELKALPNQTFSTGNAAGISFYVNGKYYAGLGHKAEVIKGKILLFTNPKESAPIQ